MTRATWAGVALTFVGVGLIARTLHHTKRAAIAAEEAVKEARAGTAAALQAVEVTREMGTRQLRAYVNIDDIGVRNFAPDKISVFRIRIKNTGTTPAYNVKTLVATGGEKEFSGPVRFHSVKPVSTAVISGDGGHFDSVTELPIEFAVQSSSVRRGNYHPRWIHSVS